MKLDYLTNRYKEKEKETINLGTWRKNSIARDCVVGVMFLFLLLIIWNG